MEAAARRPGSPSPKTDGRNTPRARWPIKVQRIAVANEHEIRIDGRRFCWRTAGEGPPLLLVNGYAAAAQDWDPAFLQVLTNSFKTICPDSRGIGRSELGSEALSIDAMAADLETLLDELSVERVHVAGWSMGGFIAQRLAARAPHRVITLALLATDPGAPHAIPAEPDIWKTLTDHSGTPREQASRLIGLLFPPDLASEIDRQFGEIVAEARAALSPQTLRAQEVAMDSWHREDQPPRRSGLPVLVAHGSLDVVIPPANALALKQAWPESQMEQFEGGGHAFMAQEPQRVADLICALAQKSG